MADNPSVEIEEVINITLNQKVGVITSYFDNWEISFEIKIQEDHLLTNRMSLQGKAKTTQILK